LELIEIYGHVSDDDAVANIDSQVIPSVTSQVFLPEQKLHSSKAVPNQEDNALCKGWINHHPFRQIKAQQWLYSYSHYHHDILVDTGQRNSNLCAE